MTPRRKRQRYRQAARELATKFGLEFKDDWETVWDILDKYEEPTYVYAIVDKQSRLVKFGRSRAPGQRLRALQTANGKALELWAYCEEQGDELREAWIHGELYHSRVHGEWFRLDEPAHRWITRIREHSAIVFTSSDRP